MPRHPRFTPDQLGPHIDLDEEVVLLPDGTRHTDARAEEIAEEAVADFHRSRGRPSVTGERARTPNLTVRVPGATRAALQSIADAQGRRLADVSRDALEEYIERHG